MSREWLSLVVLLFAVTGCTPYAERVAITCSNMGYARGTPGFSGCMRDQMQADSAEQAFWGGVAAAGVSMMQPRPTVVCTTYRNVTTCR